MSKTNANKPDGMDEQPAGAANRKRGARPGNTNALKHGFYAARFTRRKISWLDGQPVHQDLQDEINRLRVLIRRAFHALDRRSPAYRKHLLNLTEMCGEAIASLIYAVQTHRLLGQKGSDPAAEFNEIIKKMMDGSNASQ